MADAPIALRVPRWSAYANRCVSSDWMKTSRREPRRLSHYDTRIEDSRIISRRDSLPRQECWSERVLPLDRDGPAAIP